ncbi:MAG TPA: hypothetical protein VGB77_15560 [Abditibacteriaceae bacterium]|jgi:hypothetical protein
MTNEEKIRLITNGAQQAVSEAIERHRRLGESIVIWRDGQIVTLTGDEIPPQSLEEFGKEDPS